MRVVQLTGSLSRRGGGFFESVRGMSRHICAEGVEVRVLALEDADSAEDSLAWLPVKPTVVKCGGSRQLGWSREWMRLLRTINPDIVHAHGLWMFHSLASWMHWRSSGRPYVVSPRGMLEPEAFRVRTWKKLPVWMMWEKRVVQEAALLHCTSFAEAEHCWLRGYDGPVAVVPNGVEVPELPEDRKKRCKERYSVVFLGRIHPIKGLLNLIDSWALSQRPNWLLKIVGPDTYGYRRVLEKRVLECKVRSSVIFENAVFGQEKWRLLESADLFVLPSLSENFGNVVAEALGACLPVIATKGTPWRILREARCGWWVEASKESLATALDEGMRLPESERAEMGRRGRCLVEAEFAWPQVASDMIKVYEWVLGQGPKPNCVQLK